MGVVLPQYSRKKKKIYVSFKAVFVSTYTGKIAGRHRQAGKKTGGTGG